MADSNVFSKNLKAAMDRRKTGPAALSAATGVSRRYVYDILSGSASPTLEMIERLAKGLKVSSKRLICGQKKKSN
jgi:transcriptional regulator with XRE-family HTH domain